MGFAFGCVGFICTRCVCRCRVEHLYNTCTCLHYKRKGLFGEKVYCDTVRLSVDGDGVVYLGCGILWGHDVSHIY